MKRARGQVSRLKVLRAAWFLATVSGRTPTRRFIQGVLRFANGSAPRSDEVHEFLRIWQYRGEDGLLYLKPTEEIEVGPSVVLENGEMGPSEKVGPGAVQSGSRSGPRRVQVYKEGRSKVGPKRVQSGSYARAVENESLNLKERSLPTVAISARANADASQESKEAKDDEKATFDAEDEQRIKISIAMLAAESENGIIEPMKIAGIRAEMRQVAAKVGIERWRNGMDIANANAKPWVYARKIMCKKATPPPVAVATNGTVPHQNGTTNGRRRGYVDRPIAPERLAGLREIEEESRAFGQSLRSTPEALKNSS